MPLLHIPRFSWGIQRKGPANTALSAAVQGLPPPVNPLAQGQLWPPRALASRRAERPVGRGVHKKGRLKSIFSTLALSTEMPPNRPSGRRRFCGVQAFSPQAKTLVQGEFISPEHFKSKGGAALRAAKPKKKERLKSIFLNGEKCRPQGGPPTASPAQRVAVGKEEQGSRRMTSFLFLA